MQIFSSTLFSYLTASLFSIVGTVAIIFGPLTFLQFRNRRKYRKVLAEIDAGPSFVFRSEADCITRGFSPEQSAASHAAAEKWDLTLGTTASDAGFSYTVPRYATSSASALWTCEENHGKQYKQVGMSIDPPQYEPKIVGWAAVANDLTKAVPLYARPDPNEGIRWDKKIMRFDT
ncbi:MAG: hypothetical protein P4M13_12090 [Alphaproteobacteria bacterium]|nr:hypothetical protein [Alphaproteobacteria bacterium]